MSLSQSCNAEKERRKERSAEILSGVAGDGVVGLATVVFCATSDKVWLSWFPPMIPTSVCWKSSTGSMQCSGWKSGGLGEVDADPWQLLYAVGEVARDLIGDEAADERHR